jgi:hypothetical protein
MKWFLAVCALASVLGIAVASCGPEREFCPLKPQGSCFFDDGGPQGGSGGQNQGPCDGGPIMFCPPPSGKQVCSLSECP